ncbi:two-component system, NarL family, sensor histidine kinase LiaS [Paenibacillaceae bacterium GAS479]|nr:two-component system, NarL family, sensor histidine kinase LiaS [Paenibacillaceae bacterium GAS479]
MAVKKPPGNEQEPNRRNRLEIIIWLLIIMGLLLILLQGIGYVEFFALQGKAALYGLSIIAVALAVTALKSTVQTTRLKEALRKLNQQQGRRKSITIPSSKDGTEESEQEEQAQEDWREQVKFTAVIEERQRLSRELHDAVSQQLFAISMTATAVSRTIEKDWERARRQVQLIEEMAAVAQSEMRALLLHLRPVHLDGKVLAQALELLVTELQVKVPMDINIEVDRTLLFHPTAEDHLFRIAQESLSNTLRHAKATKMDISLKRDGKMAKLSFIDNGIGFDLEEKKQASYGLLTMEERIHELGGHIAVMTAPGEGTAIEMWIPIEDGKGIGA